MGEDERDIVPLGVLKGRHLQWNVELLLFFPTPKLCDQQLDTLVVPPGTSENYDLLSNRSASPDIFRGKG